MKTFLAVAMLAAIAVIGGCSTADLTDDQLAAQVQMDAMLGVEAGLDVIVQVSNGPSAATAKADATKVDGILTKDVIPVFAGAAPTAGQASTTIESFIDNLPVSIRGIVQTAIAIVSRVAPLGSVTGTAIPDRTRKAILGALKGVSQGIEAVVPPPTATPAPPMARTAPKKHGWTK